MPCVYMIILDVQLFAFTLTQKDKPAVRFPFIHNIKWSLAKRLYATEFEVKLERRHWKDVNQLPKF